MTSKSIAGKMHLLKFSRTWLAIGLGGLLGGLIGGSGVMAQVNNADLSCYLHTPEGEQFDLRALCGGFEAPRDEVVLQTGDVQVTLRWDTDDDLDLFVRGPSGDQVAYFNREIPSGGQLDVDANAGCGRSMASPVENIFWPTGGGVPGDYVVTVDLYSRCSTTSGPINYTLSTLVMGEVQTYSGSVGEGQESVDYPFSFPGGGAAGASNTSAAEMPNPGADPSQISPGPF